MLLYFLFTCVDIRYTVHQEQVAELLNLLSKIAAQCCSMHKNSAPLHLRHFLLALRISYLNFTDFCRVARLFFIFTTLCVHIEYIYICILY